MYPSSVVSNNKVKTKHPSWFFNTKHLKKQFHCLSIRLLFAQWVMSSPFTNRGRNGCIHISTQYLIKWMHRPHFDVLSQRWWRLELKLNSCIKILAFYVSQCSSRWNKNYQQINKKVQPSQTLFIPATFQTNTGTKPHPLCVHLEVSHTMRKLQLSATNLFSEDSSEGLKRKLLLMLKDEKSDTSFCLIYHHASSSDTTCLFPPDSNYIWGVFNHQIKTKWPGRLQTGWTYYKEVKKKKTKKEK